MHSITDRWTDR